METFKGKAIYNPAGPAGEYSRWACNFYMGCSNDCDYCYCKEYPLGIYWSTSPTLKRMLVNPNRAIEIFTYELLKNKEELQKYGLFFSFTTDPMLTETIKLTLNAALICLDNDVPVKILTKRADFLESESWLYFSAKYMTSLRKKNVAIGFTLTGHDEREPNASSNAERIAAMRQLYEMGFKTFSSVEPIITFEKAKQVIEQTMDCCHLHQIGLMDKGKEYNYGELYDFINWLIRSKDGFVGKIFLKHSVMKKLDITLGHLPFTFVGKKYNLFNQ
ncbi:hypothetical protein D0T49_03595 [Paludibacter sp. 221]|nr:hypothetical protein [Paludibacter sp. 221]